MLNTFDVGQKATSNVQGTGQSISVDSFIADMSGQMSLGPSGASGGFSRLFNPFGQSAKPPAPPDPADVKLQNLRSAEPAAVNATMESLKHHGFAWLDFTNEKLHSTEVNTALAEMGGFLAKHEHQGSPHAMEGHFSAAHKDGLRMVTGSWMRQSESKLPEDLEQKVLQLALDLDVAQKEVVKALAPAIGLPSSEAVGDGFGIPLLSPEKGAFKQYGLLDIVRYRMGADSPDEVVAPHADPGLLILSLPCSTPGLQLRDAKGSWLAPPSGYGVLWAGKAGRDAMFKSGIHRVVASPDRAPRLSAWHELCTRSQLCPPMLQVLEENRLQLKLGSTTGTAEVLHLLQESEDHHNVQMVQRRGVPVGKSGAIIREQFVPWTANLGLGWQGRPGARVQKMDLKLAPGQVEIIPLHGVADPTKSTTSTTSDDPMTSDASLTP